MNDYMLATDLTLRPYSFSEKEINKKLNYKPL